MLSRVMFAVAIAGIWITPALSWAVVVDTELSGFETFQLAGLLPWLLLLFVFIARYVKRPAIISTLGSLALLGIAIWLVFLDLTSLATVEEFYQSKTGLILSERQGQVQILGTHYLYSTFLVLAAAALAVEIKRTKQVRNNGTVIGEDSRSLWDDQH